MTSETVAADQIDIVRVIQRTWEIAKADFGLKFGVAALLAGLPSAVLNYLPNPETGDGDLSWSAAATISAGLFSAVGGVIVQAALIRGAVAQIDQRPSNLPDDLGTGLRLFLPLIGLTIVASLAIICGLILLVVPGVMMACAWCVAIPVLIEENTGVFGAFRRSADLTRGTRWRILGLFAAYVGVFLIVAILSSIFAGIFALPLGLDGTGRAVVAAISGLYTAVITVAASTGAGVLYDELRNRPPRSAVEEIVDILR